MIIILVYLIGVATQYVRVNTVFKEWKEERIQYCRKSYEPLISIYIAIWGSWVAFIFMGIKRFLDNKFINKK